MRAKVTQREAEARDEKKVLTSLKALDPAMS